MPLLVLVPALVLMHTLVHALMFALVHALVFALVLELVFALVHALLLALLGFRNRVIHMIECDNLKYTYLTLFMSLFDE